MGFRYKREHMPGFWDPAGRRDGHGAGVVFERQAGRGRITGVLTSPSARFLALLLSCAMLAGTGAVPAKDGTGVVWADGILAGADGIPADADGIPAGADGIPTGAGGIPADADESMVIRYSDLPELVKAYSPQVEMERIQYESRLGRYESAREDIMETRRLLREEADDMEENGDTEGARSYRAQAKILEDAAKDIDKQIRSAKGSSSTMSLRKMEDTMIWTAQSLMGTYHSLRAEQESAAANAELMQGKYEKAVRQAALGTISQADADEVGKAAQAAMNTAQALADDMGRVRKNLLMVIGYPADSAAVIDSMPLPEQGRMDNITLEVDKWRAMGNNYELRQQRGGASGGTNKELHARQRAINQEEENLYAQIDTLYQDALASRTAWQGACTAQAAREAEWKAASRRMELGMLSRQEYMEARAAYLDGVAAKAQADVNFQQAMDTYDWAVKGLTGI